MSAPHAYRRWQFSALCYTLTYIRIAHQIDDDLFAHLGSRVKGAIVADCGCGPGIVAEKFLRRGASRLFAIDVNAAMLRQVQIRLAGDIAAGRVIPMQRAFDGQIFGELREQHLHGTGFDIILFKRSLYARREWALPVLRSAISSLRGGGVLVVIHPEESLRHYVLGPGLSLAHYTAYHLFNRSISKLGEKFGFGEYTLYTRAGLLELLMAAAQGRPVELIPSQQRAYNLVAVLG